MNKQIEEIAEDLWRNTLIHSDELCEEVAEYLYNAGYRKQNEVEWVVISKRGLNSKRNRRINYETYTCAVCGRSNGKYKANYCPNCGAKMKGKHP